MYVATAGSFWRLRISLAAAPRASRLPSSSSVTASGGQRRVPARTRSRIASAWLTVSFYRSGRVRLRRASPSGGSQCRRNPPMPRRRPSGPPRRRWRLTGRAPRGESRRTPLLPYLLPLPSSPRRPDTSRPDQRRSNRALPPRPIVFCLPAFSIGFSPFPPNASGSVVTETRRAATTPETSAEPSDGVWAKLRGCPHAVVAARHRSRNVSTECPGAFPDPAQRAARNRRAARKARAFRAPARRHPLAVPRRGIFRSSRRNPEAAPQGSAPTVCGASTIRPRRVVSAGPGRGSTR